MDSAEVVGIRRVWLCLFWSILFTTIIWLVVCDDLGSTEYALKVAPIQKQASKNKLALLLVHEISYLRTRLQAFRKDYDGIELIRCSP